MHVQHGLGRETRSVVTTGAAQIRVQLVEMGDGQGAQRRPAEAGQYIAFGHLLVPKRRGGS